MQRSLKWGAAVLLVSACAGCAASDERLGYAAVLQDRFDAQTCKELMTTRDSQRNREKELVAMMEKSNEAPGGFIASTLAYRSDLVQVRGFLASAERAISAKGCDAAPAAPATPR